MNAEATGIAKGDVFPRAGVKSMVRRDVVVIGGSAGSLRPLAVLLGCLPANLPAAVFVVMHSASSYWNTNALIEVLEQEARLPLGPALDQHPVEHGKVYICPSDHHLTIENGLMRLNKAPKEHHTRPSIDVLFRSSAMEYGRRVAGVLLSGSMRDGVAGLWQIKQRGGVVLVQDPEEAESPSMPRSAIESVAVDYVQPVHQLAVELIRLLTEGTEHDEERSRTVLVVEDEGLVARNLQERLLEAGYSVSSPATSGEDAIRLASEQNPDLILMDIRLEGEMTGVQAARTIWESLQIPIVFVTANADASTLNEVKTVPNYGFIVKPFHSASIQAVVELALDRRARELRH